MVCCSKPRAMSFLDRSTAKRSFFALLAASCGVEKYVACPAFFWQPTLQSSVIVSPKYIRIRFIFASFQYASFLRNVVPGIPMGGCSWRIGIGTVLEQAFCTLAGAPRIIQHHVVGVAHANVAFDHNNMTHYTGRSIGIAHRFLCAINLRFNRIPG